MTRRFTGSFTQQAPMPEESLRAAERVLSGARLHRYYAPPDQPTEASLLEREYAAWQGAPYCLACASGGQAMQIALRAAGVMPGDSILTNAFTLAPVPGAIMAVGARPALIASTEDLTPDLDDLDSQAEATGARYLLLSLMRGHMADMTGVVDICTARGMTLIEDCAHTMGARWDGVQSGNFGLAGCFSTQTYKHMNSGEGGLLTSADPDFMARAILLSGSYMMYERHGAAPPADVLARHRLNTPNMSARMDELRAAILRPQLPHLDQAIAGWNARYGIVHDRLQSLGNRIHLARRDPRETFVGSSIQFRAPSLSNSACEALVTATAARGVELKWFGRPDPQGFTSTHNTWAYLEPRALPETDEILRTLFDMRIPRSFSLDDCRLIADILAEEILEITGA